MQFFSSSLYCGISIVELICKIAYEKLLHFFNLLISMLIDKKINLRHRQRANIDFKTIAAFIYADQLPIS